VLTGGLRITTVGLVPPDFSLHLSFFVAVPIVVTAAAIVGLLIGAPVLRLRGDYLAIVTLGFGEIARILFTSDWLKGLFGGTQGMSGIPAAPVGNLQFRNPQPFYFLVLGFCLVAVYFSWRLSDSRVGRAWNAMREDEQVAEAVGVSTVRYKLLAFAMGGAVGSLGGALFAIQVGALNDASFTILVSITALAVVILGGMGSIPGVVVGALVLIGIPGVLSEFAQYRLLLYGAVLMAIMILRPQGLIPNIRRSRELEDEERAQDKWAGEVSADEHAAPPITPLGEGAG
jgi:branched-chain amino acid transport system permease protein